MVYSKTLVLCGHFRTHTGMLGGVRWTNGRTVLEGPPRAVEGLAHYLEICYQAFPEGSAALRAKQEQLGELPSETGPRKGATSASDGYDQPSGSGSAEESDEHRSGSGEATPDDDGSENSTGSRRQEMREAVELLDRSNSEHWTMDGQPRLKPLEEILGRPLTRKEVNELLRED